MFNRKKKTQELVEAIKRKTRKEIQELTQENSALYEENKDLRFENEEQSELINKIEISLKSNKYNNEKSILNKIKELISDYQSEN